MQDLALGSDESEEAQRSRESFNRQENANLNGCILGSNNGETGLEQGLANLNWDHAIPSVAQPVFDSQGNWKHDHRAEALREQGFKVPNNLDAALDIARERATSAATAAAHNATDETDDLFDHDDFAEFYGKPPRSQAPRSAYQESPLVARKQTELAGTTTADADALMEDSATEVNSIVTEDLQETLRGQGYYQKRKSPVGEFADKYLFVSDNPYVTGSKDQITPLASDGTLERQYQVRVATVF